MPGRDLDVFVNGKSGKNKELFTIKIKLMTFIDFNTRKKIQVWDGISGPVFHSKQATFGHFTLDEGSELPPHSHPHEQWTNLIEGELEFDIAGESRVMKAGMTAFIPSNVVHSAKAITKCRLIDCFMPVREDFVEMEREAGIH